MTARPPIRILLIEDNPGDARLVREHLADASGAQDFRLEDASSLTAAMALTDPAGSPDLVLLDLSLPDSFGLETLARWQAHAPTVPVIVLTGSDDEALAVAAVREGAQDYLVKGRLDGGLLAQAIRYAIERKRVQEDLRQAKEGLEHRVEDRTTELREINTRLQGEIAERTLAQQQAAELLEREKAARAEVESVNRSKDEFLAMLSHELRTPLNAILGWSEILRSEESSEVERQEGLEVIERNARAQARLVEDVLEVSRIICGKVRLSIGSVDLTAVIDAALADARPAASVKGVTLHRSLDPLALPSSGDAGRLQQVVWNLLSNAIKFTPRGGSITVQARQNSEQTEIAVADTGAGIKADFLPFVFDRFRQSDASITRSHGGLGLGLSISRHLVEMHGGTISAASVGEGRGATFTVRLPLRVSSGMPALGEHDHPSSDAAPAPSDERVTLAGIGVLVVEDEPDSRRVLVRHLRKVHAEVREAGSVAEALDLLHGWIPDVLVSDIAMPDEDGYSLLRRLRTSPDPALQALPAIALTAFARTEDQARAVEAGFHRHLPKPFDPQALLSAIRTLTQGTSQPPPPR